MYNIDSEYVAWNGNKSDKKLQGKYVVSWRDIPNRGMQMESKSRKITFMIIQLHTKYYQLLLRNVNWQRTQTKHGTLDKTALQILTSF